MDGKTQSVEVGRSRERCRRPAAAGRWQPGARRRLILAALCIVASWLETAPSAAQARGRQPSTEIHPEATYDEPERAPVIVDGEVLFLVRGVTALPAARRARAIAERIVALAADSSISPNNLALTETPGEPWTRVMVDDMTIVTVTDADAGAERVSRKTLADVTLRRIKTAIVDYREARQPEALARHALYALGMTAAALLLAWVLRRGLAWLDQEVHGRLRAHVRGLERQSFRIIQAHQLWAAVHGAVRVLRIALLGLLVYVYLNLTLSLFPWTRGLARNLFALVVDPLQSLSLAIVQAVPDLMFIGVVVLLARYMLRAAHLFFSGIEAGTIRPANFDREWALPTYRIVRVLVVAFALVVSYPYIPGSGSEAFKGISIFLGVVFSLGSSSVMASIMAGYAMTYRRAFRVGDRVKINDVVGDVVEVRLMVTRLRSPKNEEVVIPNSAIQNETVINYSAMARDRGLILHTTVGIGYETPWRQVEAILLTAAQRTAGLLHEPPPFVLQKALGDFAVTYEINAYCDNPQASMKLYSELHRNILDAFNEYGVQVMTPAYEGDPAQAKLVPPEQWFAAPAMKPPG